MSEVRGLGIHNTRQRHAWSREGFSPANRLGAVGFRWSRRNGSSSSLFSWWRHKIALVDSFPCGIIVFPSVSLNLLSAKPRCSKRYLSATLQQPDIRAAAHLPRCCSQPWSTHMLYALAFRHLAKSIQDAIAMATQSGSSQPHTWTVVRWTSSFSALLVTRLS